MFPNSCSALLFALYCTLVGSHSVGRRQGAIPYGSVISKCTQPGVVALTFDDGPSKNTATVLDKLKAAGMRATFFINGNNYGYIYNYNSTVRRYITDGHQIGSHTWDHPHLPTLSTAEMVAEMTQLEDALVKILGYFPYYMRVPYFDYGTTVLPIMAQLQYHVVQCDIDTLDWEYNTNDTICTAEQIYTDGLKNGGTISLSHDPLPYTGIDLVDYMINAVKSRGLRSVPVGECLGDPPANWYRPARSAPPVITSSTSSVSSSSPAQPTNTISPDGTCGGTKGFVCPSGSCCSKYSNCGVTNDYCIGQNCQPAFGLCKADLPAGSVSPDGTCGGKIGYLCPTGKCCSVGGWCGTTSAYCGTGCQLAYGVCSAPSTYPSPTPVVSSSSTPTLSPIVSTDGTCGGIMGYTCKTGQCCSKYGHCGTSNDYCIGQNCQSAFGTCKANLPAGSTSPDGTCGGTIGYVCPSGSCCSKSNWCGTTSVYCGTGCQRGFGFCS